VKIDERRKDTILAAGDYFNDLDMLVIRLQAEKFKVIPIKDRNAVVDMARSEIPSLILLDFKSSFDLCRMLKRNFVTERIPIITLLFPAEEADRIASFELGADDCLPRPYSFRELLLRIKCSLRRARDNEGKARYRCGQHYAAFTKPRKAD
jgi:DNA-binding response OmpR family regulator